MANYSFTTWQFAHPNGISQPVDLEITVQQMQSAMSSRDNDPQVQDDRRSIALRYNMFVRPRLQSPVDWDWLKKHKKLIVPVPLPKRVRDRNGRKHVAKV